MDVISYSRLRQNLASVMDSVCETHAPVVVSRRGGEAVVMMSLEEFNALEDTLHLLRSPRNAERLMHGMEAADAGRLTERPLADPE